MDFLKRCCAKVNCYSLVFGEGLCKDHYLEKLHHQLEIQTKRVENLKKSNEFYASPEIWIQDTADCMGFTYRRRIPDDDVSVEEVWMREYMDNRYYGGKLARSCQAIDQDLEKQLEEVK